MGNDKRGVQTHPGIWLLGASLIHGHFALARMASLCNTAKNLHIDYMLVLEKKGLRCCGFSGIYCYGCRLQASQTSHHLAVFGLSILGYKVVQYPGPEKIHSEPMKTKQIVVPYDYKPMKKKCPSKLH